MVTEPDPRMDTIRTSLHAAIDRILWAWPHALTDIAAIGYPSSSRPNNRASAELTSVESAAEHLLERGNHAAGFIAELWDVIDDLTHGTCRADWTPSTAKHPLHQAVDELVDELTGQRQADQGPLDLIRRIDRLALHANTWQPPPEHGQTVDGVTIGERGNQAEICGYCQNPVVSGRDPNGNSLLRRDKDGTPFHATALDTRPACYWIVWRQRRTGSGRNSGWIGDQARGWCA